MGVCDIIYTLSPVHENYSGSNIITRPRGSCLQLYSSHLWGCPLLYRWKIPLVFLGPVHRSCLCRTRGSLAGKINKACAGIDIWDCASQIWMYSRDMHIRDLFLRNEILLMYMSEIRSLMYMSCDSDVPAQAQIMACPGLCSLPTQAQILIYRLSKLNPSKSPILPPPPPSHPSPDPNLPAKHSESWQFPSDISRAAALFLKFPWKENFIGFPTNFTMISLGFHEITLGSHEILLGFP
jgi:hypothetical protein